MEKSRGRTAPHRSQAKAKDLNSLRVSVIGLGAVGRQLALRLALLRPERLELIDPALVEFEDVASAGYWLADIGRPKVRAVAEAIAQVHPDLKVEQLIARFKPNFRAGEAVFFCVKRSHSRAAIWRSMDTLSQFWCDGIVRGNVSRILTAHEAIGRRQFVKAIKNTPFAGGRVASEPVQGYAASIAAGLMANQFHRWVRGRPIDRELKLDLVASRCSVR